MSRSLDRRSVLTGALSLAGVVALPARALALTPQEQASVAKAQAYLQGLGSVRGRFTQTDARGRVSKGDLYIQRPGKARFVYDPPSGLLIVSNGRAVTVHDRRLKTRNTYPLSSTPLNLFLARNIRLDKSVEIARFERFPDGFGVTARDRTGKTRGWITLTFAEAPLRLTEWTVADARGTRTRVQLQSLTPVSGLDPALFSAAG